MSRHPAPVRDPILAASEVVALRFPDELLDLAPPAEPSAVDESTPSDAAETFALFNPLPTYPLPTYPLLAAPAELPQLASATGSVQLVSLPQPAPAPNVAPAPVSQAQLAAAATKLASTAPRRSVNTRPGAVLSEGQIASIKQRLKLTPDQQHMWPAVEVALRNLSYDKKSDGARKGSQEARVASLDSGSAGVKDLTSAAFPLIMSFNDDQKRELHVLARVAGLEQLVPRF